ncbi:hypothetical protein HD554DRAFT_2172886 [Boletus coccyginus]|nr:hypothetical protein HD554DRAFT_2172886 [Boletus coccyginus]
MPPSESLPSEQATAWVSKSETVGTVDERGRFDFFFNILEPSPEISDSLRLNLPRVVEDDTRCVDEELLPREVVSSPETPWAVDQIEVLTVADTSRKTTQYSSTLSNDGAHIILPQGAQSFELPFQQRKIFESYAREHGAEWIERSKDQLGWPRSNSLYLLTGFYKTCSWSIASFGMETAANTDPVYVYCSLVELDERTIRQESVWHPAGRFKRKIGPPPDRQGRDNQTVFVRGITITPRVSQDGQTEEPHATSTWFNRPATYIPFLNTMMGSTEVAAAQTPGGVIIGHVPPISQAIHPSEVINQYLLKKEPSARIAVTHDSQWISMLEMLGKGRSWKLDDLESHLDSLVSERYAITRHNSAVYLRDKEYQSLTNFSVERMPLPRDMSPYDSRSQEPQSAGVQHSGSLDDHRSSPGSNGGRYDVVHPDRHRTESDADADTRGVKHNYVTILYNHLQRRYEHRLLTWMTSSAGPADALVWSVECKVGHQVLGRGSASRLRDAKEKAAQFACQALGISA